MYYSWKGQQEWDPWCTLPLGVYYGLAGGGLYNRLELELFNLHLSSKNKLTLDKADFISIITTAQFLPILMYIFFYRIIMHQMTSMYLNYCIT